MNHDLTTNCHISNFPCSRTRDITSHSMKNLAFHSLLRWKMTLHYQFSLPRLYISLKRWWKNVLLERRSERVKASVKTVQFRFWVAYWRLKWNIGSPEPTNFPSHWRLPFRNFRSCDKNWGYEFWEPVPIRRLFTQCNCVLDTCEPDKPDWKWPSVSYKERHVIYFSWLCVIIPFEPRKSLYCGHRSRY